MKACYFGEGIIAAFQLGGHADGRPQHKILSGKLILLRSCSSERGLTRNSRFACMLLLGLPQPQNLLQVLDGCGPGNWQNMVVLPVDVPLSKGCETWMWVIVPLK